MWSDYEKSGHTVANADDLPCTAYDCARQCSQKYYPADVSDSETDLSGYKSQYECVAACPGVNIPTWDEIMSEGDGGSSSSVTGFATTQGIASSTSSTRAASATKTSSTTLSTATGTAAGQGTASSSSTTSKTSSGTTGGTAASATTSSASSTATHASGSTQNVAGSVSFIFGGALAAMVAIYM